eukprot:1303429-Rhodomonas_salina.5
MKTDSGWRVFLRVAVRRVLRPPCSSTDSVAKGSEVPPESEATSSAAASTCALRPAVSADVQADATPRDTTHLDEQLEHLSHLTRGREDRKRKPPRACGESSLESDPRPPLPRSLQCFFCVSAFLHRKVERERVEMICGRRPRRGKAERETH